VEAVTERESKARLGREVIAKTCEYVSAVSWPQDLASGVTESGAWTGHESQPHPEKERNRCGS
jgi:hypothetical protein